MTNLLRFDCENGSRTYSKVSIAGVTAYSGSHCRFLNREHVRISTIKKAGLSLLSKLLWKTNEKHYQLLKFGFQKLALKYLYDFMVLLI